MTTTKNTKAFQRTENNETRIVSIREGLDEANHAMMGGKKDVKTMSATSDRYDITYKDGRHVVLIKIDKPVEEKPAPKNLQTHTGAVHAPGGYDKVIRSNKPRCVASRSAIMRLHYLVEVEGDVTCKRCAAILEKEAQKG